MRERERDENIEKKPTISTEVHHLKPGEITHGMTQPSDQVPAMRITTKSRLRDSDPTSNWSIDNSESSNIQKLWRRGKKVENRIRPTTFVRFVRSWTFVVHNKTSPAEKKNETCSFCSNDLDRLKCVAILIPRWTIDFVVKQYKCLNNCVNFDSSHRLYHPPFLERRFEGSTHLPPPFSHSSSHAVPDKWIGDERENHWIRPSVLGVAHDWRCLLKRRRSTEGTRHTGAAR